MKMKFRAIVILFVVIETLSIIHGYVLLKEWMAMGLMCGISMFMYPKAFHNKPTMYLLMYFTFLMMFVAMGHSLANTRWVLIEILVPFSFLSIINVFIYNHDFEGLKIVTVVGLIIIALTAVLTIPIVIKDPMAVRRMVTFSNSNNFAAMQMYQRQGIASFGLVHAFAFLCPLLVFQVKSGRNQIFRMFSVAVLLVTYLMIIKVSFATPIILCTFAIAYAFVLSKNKRVNLVIGVVLISALSTSLNKDLLTSGLTTISKTFFANTPVSEKIDNIKASIQHEQFEGQVSGRGKLYDKSWITFFDNPILGSLDKTQAGGHAYFVDRLAYFGLFGTLPFLMFLFFTLKRNLTIIGSQMRPHYVLCLFFFVILGLTKNISGRENFLYLFVLLPGLCLIGEPVKNQRVLLLMRNESVSTGLKLP